ncbi:GNAT family N-acetyltransferase [Sorangium sp. So ce406]|uniref:GNAT family N-acetyltransferase n=1 Tax=Sorangium sp. So ce406 TaxID=3133311 RepID=UPI003F5C1FE4
MRWQISALAAPGAILETTYPALWSADPHRSPFCAPAYLDEMAELARRDGAAPLVATALAPDGSAVAAWPLRRERSGVIQMLNIKGADHCTCVTREGAAPEALGEGLARALADVDGSGLLLKNVPSWGPTLEAARRGIAAAGWSGRSFTATPSTVLRVPEGAGAADALRRKVSGSSLKNLDNRLKRLPGFAFKALEGDAGLEAWVDAFCDAHERRWNTTTTPSEYRFAEARRRFLARLRGWARDGVLVRFSLEAADEGIAFAVGLTARDRLVYHHVAYSPVHAACSPSTVLIRRIVLWMGERGYTCMDFGIGGESYKRRFANVDEPLFRLIAAPRAASALYVRGLVEERIRASSRLQALWDEWGNRKLRGAMMSNLGRSRNRLRRAVVVDVRQPLGVLVGRARSRLERERMLFYRAPAEAGQEHPDVVQLRAPELLAMLEDEVALDAQGRAKYLEALSQGQRAFGVLRDGRAVQVCWLRPAAPEEVPPGAEGAPAWVIADCVTARRARGQGLYPRVLRAVRAAIPPGEACFIYTNDWNVASQRGILKAGFQPASIRERRRRGSAVETQWLSAP